MTGDHKERHRHLFGFWQAWRHAWERALNIVNIPIKLLIFGHNPSLEGRLAFRRPAGMPPKNKMLDIKWVRMYA
jgi:hypothetical protein